MSAADRIRGLVSTARTGDVIEHTAVAVHTDEAEALCDLADAARELIATAPGAGTSYPDGEDGSIVRREKYRALRAALARLDGEATS